MTDAKPTPNDRQIRSSDITPPPELVQQWYDQAKQDPCGPINWVAVKAAQWGADMELEACCEWVSQWRCMVGGSRPEVGLRAARRPKPPSLKEQALAVLESVAVHELYGGATADNRLSADDMRTIRRAIEALPE